MDFYSLWFPSLVVGIFANIDNICCSKHSAQRHEKDVLSFYRTLGANKFVCRYRDCVAAFDNIYISVSANTVRNDTRRMCTASTGRWAPTSSSAAIGIAPPPLTKRRISACTARLSTRQSSGSVFSVLSNPLFFFQCCGSVTFGTDPDPDLRIRTSN